jgi:hypothetical protein
MRRSRDGLSSLYGAFIVVMVTALVAGIIASQAALPAPSRTQAQREADLFLETLLRSTLNGTNESAMGAISHLCMALPCSAEDPSPQSIMNGLGPLASKLAAALGRPHRISLSDGAGQTWETGGLSPGDAAALSTVQLLHGPSGRTLAVSAFVGWR